MEEKLIFKKLVAINKRVEAIKKDRKNQSQGYQFRGVDDVMNELHTLFAEEGVIILTELIEQNREERQTKNGGLLLYSLNVYKFTLVAEDGSSVYVTQVGEGMDSGDKACNKSASAALKYALIFMFLIPTESDKDSENYDPEPVVKESSKPAEEKKETTKAEDEKKDLKPDLPLWAKVIAWGKGKDVEVWIRNRGKYDITPEDEKLLFEELGWKVGE